MKDRTAGAPPPPHGDELRSIRERAEVQFQQRLRGRVEKIDNEDVQQLVHELGVYQIELEMQNEQLRQAQAALEASRDRYVALYEQAPIGYITTNLAGLIIEANPPAALLLRSGRLPVVGRQIGEFFVAGDRQSFNEACVRARAEGSPQSLQLRMFPAAGEPVWVAMTLALVVDSFGERQLRIALLDDTQRIQLSKDRAHLAAIVASSDDAIIGRDLDGRITSWNGGAERLFGVPAVDALGKTLDIVMPLERRGDDRAMIRRLRRGMKVTPFEVEWRDAAGGAVPLLVSLSPIFDETGRIAGSSLVGRNVAERKRQEHALHVRLRQLDVLAQAGQTLIMAKPHAAPLQQELFDRVRLAIDGEIYLYHTVRDAATLGMVSQHGLSNAGAAAMAVQPIDHSLCGLTVTRRSPLIVEVMQESTLPEAALLKREGVRCYAGFPLLAHDLVHGVAAFASTTRDRFREGDLQVMQNVCDQIAAMLDRTALIEALHASEDSLKIANRRKDDFIATLAHELRNPLAPIRNAVGILARSALPDPQLAWCRGVIERQVTQMTRLLEDLLDVSRVTRNKIELRRERVQLRPLLEDAIEVTRPLIDAERHALRVDIPGEPIVLYGDPARLTQVVGNLLNNAAKYTDAGGVIELAVRRAPDCVEITVRDNGIGMDPRQASQVFDMFAQLAPALERSRGGLGIGLALSRGLVELHGGLIEARSAGLGRGSEFVVRLPVVHVSDGASVLSPASAHAARTELAGQRVLVVDDNVDAAETLASMLRLDGVETQVAFDGKEGLAMVEAWRPDAAVIDIGLPHFNGYELCRRIREQPWGGQMVLVACTGWGQSEDRARARAAGFDLHLVKPIDFEELTRSLVAGRLHGGSIG